MAVDVHAYTFQDMVDFYVNMTEAGSRTKGRSMVREAVLSAMNDVYNSHRWLYYFDEGRVNLVSNYKTGTIAFDLTGGANEYQLTLTGGTWPSWAKFGRVTIANVVYPVNKRISDTVLTLDADLAPTADIAASTTYNLYRAVYPMPKGVRAIDHLINETQFWQSFYVNPTEWMARERFYRSGGQPWAFTIMKDPDEYNGFALWMDPWPSEAQPLGFIYHRRPRPLRWSGHESTSRDSLGAGPSSGDSTITTTSTLPQSMVGSFVRLNNDASNHPTGISGQHPFIEQHEIESISGQTVTLKNTTLTQAYTNGTKIVITDPLDIPEHLVELVKATIDNKVAIATRDRDGMAVTAAIRRREMSVALEGERMEGADYSMYDRDSWLFTHHDVDDLKGN